MYETPQQLRVFCPVATSDTKERVVLLGSSQTYQGGRFNIFWSDFGGRLDGDESVKEAALREFMKKLPISLKGTVKSSAELVKMHSILYASYVAEIPYVGIDKIKEHAEKGSPNRHNV